VSPVGYVACVTIEPYSDDPLYVQLTRILREKIRSGEYARLDRLPSEQSLVQQYGVSRDTVRKVVALLRDEGLVFTLGQRGTYVGPKPDS
jgi:GntR family transcriptional regulator